MFATPEIPLNESNKRSYSRHVGFFFSSYPIQTEDYFSEIFLFKVKKILFVTHSLI